MLTFASAMLSLGACDDPSDHHASCTAIAVKGKRTPEWCDPKAQGEVTCHRCLFSFRANQFHDASKEVIYPSEAAARDAAEGFGCRDLESSSDAVVAYCPAEARSTIDPGRWPPRL